MGFPTEKRLFKRPRAPFRDGTCPDVGIIAGKVKSHAEKGFSIVIFGDPEHPEVIGLMGYAKEKAHVVANENDITSFLI